MSDNQIKKAIELVSRIVDTERRPQRLSHDTVHEYHDKFDTMRFIQLSAIQAALNVLHQYGITKEILADICFSRHGRSVVPTLLEWRGQIACVPATPPSATRTEKSPTQFIQQTRVTTGNQKTKETSTTTTMGTEITEYFWDVTVDWSFSISLPKTVLDTDETKYTKIPAPKPPVPVRLTTRDKNPPKCTNWQTPRVILDLTWLVHNHLHVTDDLKNVQARFDVDRSSSECKTPRRNPEVKSAEEFWDRWSRWTANLWDGFNMLVCAVQCPVVDFWTDMIVPIAPVVALESQTLQTTSTTTTATNTTVMSSDVDSKSDRKTIGTTTTTNRAVTVQSNKKQRLAVPFDALKPMMVEHRLVLDEKRPSPSSATLISITRFMVCLSRYAMDIGTHTQECIKDIEITMHKQLISAVGEHITAHTFGAYSNGCMSSLMESKHAPKPFCHLIRVTRDTKESALSPTAEGILQMEIRGDNNQYAPITTFRHALPTQDMTFELTAAVNVTFRGTRELHGWINHQFSSENTSELRLNAQSNTCSAYVLQLGRVLNNSQFKVEHSVIVRDREAIQIMNSVKTLPTKQQFKDMIRSLSPEQQKFSEQFRDYQLSSTVFGIHVIPIVPAMETILNLPAGALDQEIELKNQLLDLFITQQIPSTLLAYKTSNCAFGQTAIVESVSETAALEHVKRNVGKLRQWITQLSNEKLDKKRKDRKMDHADEEEDNEDGCATGCAVPSPKAAVTRVVHESKMSPLKSGGAGGNTADVPMSFFGAFACAASVPSTSSLASFGNTSGSISPFDFGFVGAAPSLPTRSTAMDMTVAPSFGFDQNFSIGSPTTTSMPGDTKDVKRDSTEPVSTPNANGCGVELDIAGIQDRIQSRLAGVPGNDLRPAIINVSENWCRVTKPLVGSPQTIQLNADDQHKEHVAATLLLGVLSNDGMTALKNTQLYIFVATTSHFDKSVLDTVIQDNINPLDRVLHSGLVFSTALRRLTDPNAKEIDHVRLSKGETVARLLAGPILTLT